MSNTYVITVNSEGSNVAGRPMNDNSFTPIITPRPNSRGPEDRDISRYNLVISHSGTTHPLDANEYHFDYYPLYHQDTHNSSVSGEYSDTRTRPESQSDNNEPKRRQNSRGPLGGSRTPRAWFTWAGFPDLASTASH